MSKPPSELKPVAIVVSRVPSSRTIDCALAVKVGPWPKRSALPCRTTPPCTGTGVG
jgi:hypothetical protein